jgi:hypothetical protein
VSDGKDVEQYERFFRDPQIGDGVLRPGLSGLACRNLRIALRSLGLGRDLAFSDEYDESLAKAVLAFQTRHDHPTKDGHVGRGTRRLLVTVLLAEIGERVFARMEDPSDGSQELKDLKQKLPELAEDLRSLEKLLTVDVPSALNKIRYIAEKVLHRLCMSSNVSWGQGEPTLERMIGPLVAAGRIPKSAALHVRIVQLVASPGSHFQESELSQAHLEIGMLGLVGFLEWRAEHS